ncbi:MAG TPA: C40 family peptidase [Burkholderiales bacterium]|nr:C40 family peptidase [Burkholderiales bacterium]
MIARALAASLALLVAACSGIPRSQEESSSSSVGMLAAANALKVVGTRYQYGGADPVSGFDCSGLVQFSYREAGIALPRTTEAQRLASRLIQRTELQAGDLIFFDLESKKNSHVGIYAGDGSFVHAPSTGKDVRRDRLDAPYWKKRISETRRLAI